ncbi:sterol desaturase family protein [uncultured Enterovirga sp.]|uniref:sterol desaturase family protein n=1 Tax=uncultured Enterovirga sp. TaxID=2026352 RepID=UPI0035CC2828
MSVLVNIVVVVGTVVAMEGVALLTHKYLMHGPGWGWHRSHHEPHEGVFEKNDLYAVVFGAFAFALFLYASQTFGWLYWVAVGMSVYGLLYFVVHDGLVHQRWPFRHVPKNPYLKRLVQAHRLHHAVEGREGCVSFGFLYAPPVRRLRERLRHGRGARPDTGREVQG